MNTCFTRGTAAKELITHDSSKSRTASKCIFLPGNIRPPDRLDYFPTFLEATATKVRRCQTRHASTLLQAKSRVDGHFVGHRTTWGLGLLGNRVHLPSYNRLNVTNLEIRSSLPDRFLLFNHLQFKRPQFEPPRNDR